MSSIFLHLLWNSRLLPFFPDSFLPSFFLLYVREIHHLIVPCFSISSFSSPETIIISFPPFYISSFILSLFARFLVSFLLSAHREPLSSPSFPPFFLFFFFHVLWKFATALFLVFFFHLSAHEEPLSFFFFPSFLPPVTFFSLLPSSFYKLGNS